MALISCPDCQSQLSDQAPACPKCGRPAAVAPQRTRAEGSPRTALRVAVDAAIRAGALGLLLGLFTFTFGFYSQYAGAHQGPLSAVKENLESILEYSFLAALAFAVVGAALGVIVNFRRSEEE